MKYILESKNWTTALAILIAQCEDGDEIVFGSDNIKQVGERAKNRMCPEKSVTFSVEDTNHE